MDAALIQNKLHDSAKYEVKNSAVMAAGEANSQQKGDRAEKVALGVSNLKQVVNDLQVKNQKASSSEEDLPGPVPAKWPRCQGGS